MLKNRVVKNPNRITKFLSSTIAKCRKMSKMNILRLFYAANPIVKYRSISHKIAPMRYQCVTCVTFVRYHYALPSKILIIKGLQYYRPLSLNMNKYRLFL